MPQLSGIDMQLLLKQQGYSIPVIFITAFWSDSARKVAISNGASCYLEKPLDAQTFENALNQVLGPDV
jgi:FixJ family two-component response regulator